MKKTVLVRHILTHGFAIGVFLVVTITFFNPIFFDNKALVQHDIQQVIAVSKSLQDYRAKTGEEGLWAPSIFSGMPAYLVQVNWGTTVIIWVKRILSFGLPHPVLNIYWAFLSYYILLLAFRIKPMLAIAGALAFGLSSYMIIGLGAGHNSRIGAIAYMPLVMAGIHLVFSQKRWLGFGVTALGMALNLRENHLQITYYLLLIVLLYGLIQFIIAWRDKQLAPLGTNLLVLICAVTIAVGSFTAPLWAIAEYSQYSIRGPSELRAADNKPVVQGLSKDYAFAYSNSIGEPMTLLVPNVFGGSSANFLINDTQSSAYKTLNQQGNPNVYNQLARYTTAYWGAQPYTAPYYAGAVVFFLFVLGLLCAERKYVWWLLSVSVLGIMLSWGSHFPSFNYFMFDYFPGYNKFRSVTFAIIMPLFAMPLLGLLGLTQLLEWGMNNRTKKMLRIALLATGGILLSLLLSAGIISFLREGESQLPAWFLNALVSDRKDLFRKDVFRSLMFILVFFGLLFFALRKKISYPVFSILLAIITVVDLTMVDRRYFSSDNYQRKRHSNFIPLAVDKEILKDKDYYRVYNIQENWSQEGRTSYFHNSIGGYHGAKLRRYQDMYDSCLRRETIQLIDDAKQGKLDFRRYVGLNMLNVRYIIFGPQRQDFLRNPAADGNAWFIKQLKKVSTPTEELAATCRIDTDTEAVINNAQFKTRAFDYDSAATIMLQEFSPPRLRYTSSSLTGGVAVFSEIFYPVGWHAFIDGKEAPILRVNYLLRALEIPAGKHRVEFRFEPDPYVIGGNITRASSWVLVILVLGSVAWSLRSAMYDAVPKRSTRSN